LWSILPSKKCWAQCLRGEGILLITVSSLITKSCKKQRKQTAKKF
jgi:hypothetical protein